MNDPGASAVRLRHAPRPERNTRRWRGLPYAILLCLLLSSCAPSRGPGAAASGGDRRGRTTAGSATVEPFSLKGCETLRVFVHPPPPRSFTVSVERGVMTRRKARLSNRLSRRLAGSFVQSLEAHEFERVDSEEQAYWIATTQAQASELAGRFIAVVQMRHPWGGGSETQPIASPDPDEPADGFSALIESEQVRLHDTSADLASQAARLLLPHAEKVCRARREAEAAEHREIRESLAKEMNEAREQARKRLDLDGEEAATGGAR